MTQISRRTVAQGLAWAAPAIAAANAVPAFATSNCEPIPVTVDWASGRYKHISLTSGQYVVPLSDGTNLTVAIKSTFSSMTPSDKFGIDYNLKVTDYAIGGSGKPGLELHQNNYD